MKCEEDINECKEDDPCAENNTIECVNTDGSYECRCEIGWEGEDCTEEKKYCEDELCLNGGTCNEDHSNENGYNCSCEDTGFEGLNCENDIEECFTNTCENGECEEPAPGNFSCNCGTTGYYGDLCEIPCKGDDGNCLNDATCKVSKTDNQSVMSTECMCADGFEGYLCEDKTDESSGSQIMKFAKSEKGIIVFVLLGILIILMIVVVLLVIIHRLKRSRAKSGDYFPRPTERIVNVFQIPVESDLQLPKEERLI